MKNLYNLLFLLIFSFTAFTQKVTYPFPVHYLSLTIEQRNVKMAYMDVLPDKPNGHAVLLLHGKNFNGYYWKDVINFLVENGYRVIVPDQVGWGMSDKPDIHYSFHLLAANTKALLDTLGIKTINMVGHSMGGMLATLFTLMFPGLVKKLIYEDPIGLEDYKTFVPYQSITEEYNREIKSDYASLRKYQQGYFPEWKPEYEPLVAAQYASLYIPDFKTATWASALTYEMIYEQPVLYEFKNIHCPTLMMIGQADRTVVGKSLLPKEEAQKHGNYPALGKWFHNQITNSELIELNGVGHIPHIQVPELFKTYLLNFLNK